MTIDSSIPETRPIPQEAFDWYDEYAHGFIDRRTFMARLTGLAATGTAFFHQSAWGVARALYRCADGGTICEADDMIPAPVAGYLTEPVPAPNAANVCKSLPKERCPMKKSSCPLIRSEQTIPIPIIVAK